MKQCQFQEYIKSPSERLLQKGMMRWLLFYQHSLQFEPPCTAREGRDCHHYQETEKMSNLRGSGPKQEPKRCVPVLDRGKPGAS